MVPIGILARNLKCTSHVTPPTFETFHFISGRTIRYQCSLQVRTTVPGLAGVCHLASFDPCSPGNCPIGSGEGPSRSSPCQLSFSSIVCCSLGAQLSSQMLAGPLWLPRAGRFLDRSSPCARPLALLARLVRGCDDIDEWNGQCGIAGPTARASRRGTGPRSVGRFGHV